MKKLFEKTLIKISTWIEKDFDKWFEAFAAQLTGWGERLFWFILGFAVISLLDGVSKTHISAVLNDKALFSMVLLLVLWLRVMQLFLMDLIDYENGGHRPERGAK